MYALLTYTLNKIVLMLNGFKCCKQKLINTINTSVLKIVDYKSFIEMKLKTNVYKTNFYKNIKSTYLKTHMFNHFSTYLKSGHPDNWVGMIEKVRNDVKYQSFRHDQFFKDFLTNLSAVGAD